MLKKVYMVTFLWVLAVETILKSETFEYYLMDSKKCENLIYTLLYHRIGGPQRSTI